ncbi:MAG: DUF4199 domain-containing protein [Phenylobacterium sp.]|jgi:hypothetical protein|uniref:DUF4199 domain-containing protein n=1 Tax=Phenylobacterium sp. TaxID=1871053 RepID=UPI001B3D7415|nr:DUF4199 domain-containing protein [Phenylobacterium sp.]MBP7818264.1 DUF4199 domain-containing protein [Phenylobacterium sp.]
MTRTILTYGLISGLVAIAGIVASIMLAPDGHGSMLVGYLIMLVALSSILVAVKQYRDTVLGGVIRFHVAFLMGLAIAVLATAAYVAGWEAYLAATGYRFMPEMVAETLASKRAAGVTGAEYAKLAADMQAMARSYENPLARWLMTSAEIFPVGLLVALVSAGLLRMPGFLPARSHPA